MLGKLLKYDLRSIGKVWWISMLTMLFSAFSASVALRINSEISLKPDSSDLVILQLGSYAAFLLFAVVAGLCFVSVSIMVYVRYFKHLFTDEGYLTFTLPVSRKQILFSKTVNAFVWNVLSYAVLFVCIAMCVVVSTPTRDSALFNMDTLKQTTSFIDNFFSGIYSDGWFFSSLHFAISVLIILVTPLLSTAVVYFCITLGATVVKKGKVLVAIGVYYVLNMVYSLAIQFIGVISIIALFTDFAFRMTDPVVSNSWWALVLFVILVAMATFAALFYCLTLNILERKLNLS